jgi:hypothetical protein
MNNFMIRQLYSEEGAPVTTEQKARSAPELVWILWKENLLPVVRRKPQVLAYSACSLITTLTIPR